MSAFDARYPLVAPHVGHRYDPPYRLVVPEDALGGRARVVEDAGRCRCGRPEDAACHRRVDDA